MNVYKAKLKFKIEYETEVEIKAETIKAAMDTIPSLDIKKTQFNMTNSTEPKLVSIEEVK